MTQAILNEKGFATTAGTLTAFAYLPETGEYASEITPYISLGTGLPANSTLTAPPVEEAGFIYCWDGKEWNKIENHRGETVYNEKDGSPFEVKQLGALPEGYTEIAPPALKAGETLGGFKDGKWVVNPPTDIFRAQQNLNAYYQSWNKGAPIGNAPPENVVAAAKKLAEWLHSQEAMKQKKRKSRAGRFK